MKKLLATVAMTALVIGAAGSAGAADFDHSNWGHDQGANHQWNRGEHMGQNDWNQAQVVDYRQHNLRRPPRGYEWRESNGQFILAAVATGVIASIILDHGR